MSFKNLLLSFAILFVVSCVDNNSNLSIDYEKYTLDNGLKVILHKDNSDPLVAISTIVHVGSNREKPGKTGFAHFFEHMAFTASENTPRGANRLLIPTWGGSRNGGTSFDYTIYYEVVPKNALETVLWLESDRMGFLINTVTEAAFANQQEVVQLLLATKGFDDSVCRARKKWYMKFLFPVLLMLMHLSKRIMT